MKPFRFTTLDFNPSLVRSEHYEIKFGDKERAAIEKNWEEEQKVARGKLTNENLVCVEGLSTNKTWPIVEMDYKSYLYLQKDTALRDQLNLWPLGVSGYLRVEDALVLGKRAKWVNAEPGKWEFAPSGQLDAVVYSASNNQYNMFTQILEEAGEELGVDARHLQVDRVFGASEEFELHFIDLCIALESKLSKKDFFGQVSQRKNDEYSEIILLNRKEIKAFISANEGCIVGLSRFLLDQWDDDKFSME